MTKIFHPDRLGITASGLCAIHCAVLPFVVSTLPFWGLAFLAHPVFEGTMIIISLMLGLGSIGHSYRFHHRRLGPLFLLAAGFLFILLGHLVEIEWLESILVPSGGVVIACAHLINLRMNRSCKMRRELISEQ
ncbi:MerC domain-containing protein [Pedobacter sp. SYP-B3415]|uniref:MerC domain-containing protein n=1 Tax=Pedobacter sp. SYP-B3415 TaxID=2496641 RepID=UPI00101DA199|nr:MerC domain-containing protein [Pedobacter sp. SYP-B3415]